MSGSPVVCEGFFLYIGEKTRYFTTLVPWVLLQDRGKDGHLLLGWSIIGLFLLLEPLGEPLDDRVSFALYLRSSLLLGERK